MVADSEPIDFRAALKEKVWKEAMKEEQSSIEKNQIWDLTKLPRDKKAINVKWVFKLKLNLEGKVVKHKAMLVARDFLQKKRY